MKRYQYKIYPFQNQNQILLEYQIHETYYHNYAVVINANSKK